MLLTFRDNYMTRLTEETWRIWQRCCVVFVWCKIR